MKLIQNSTFILFLLVSVTLLAQKQPTDYVNPFLGTATLWDPAYIITIPLFDQVKFDLGGKSFTIRKKNTGRKITKITYNNREIKDHFISFDELKKGQELNIITDSEE